MDKELILGMLSLSCVENYFMGWCRENEISLEMLYNQSFVSISECADAFINKGERYENYGGIKRIQDVAEEYKIVKHNYYDKNFCLTSLIKTEIAENSLILVQVNKNFFTDTVRVPWREDHYICITKITDSGFNYINNYPLKEGIMESEQLIYNFGGSVIVYKKTGCYDIENIISQNNKQLDKMILSGNYNFNIDLTAENSQKLRDCIGILKISRKRLFTWINYMSNLYSIVCDGELEECLKKDNEYLNRLYTYLEVQKLRKKFDNEKTDGYLKAIEAEECRIQSLLKMRRIINEKDGYI